MAIKGGQTCKNAKEKREGKVFLLKLMASRSMNAMLFMVFFYFHPRFVK